MVPDSPDRMTDDERVSRVPEAAEVSAAEEPVRDSGAGGLRTRRGSMKASSAVGLAVTIPALIAACILVGVWLGNWLDKWLGSGPWLMLAGLLLGIVAAVRETMRLLKRINREEQREVAAKRKGSGRGADGGVGRE